jgi:ABC-type nitrate/sulfonate/bicarbonate transport system substrate-binding protein
MIPGRGLKIQRSLSMKMTNRNNIHSVKRQFADATTNLLIILAIVVSSVACTPSDHKSTNAPSEKITFAYTILPDAALVQVAQLRGYYKEEGLDVTPQVHQIGKDALEAVMEGKADFATVAETPVVFKILKG